MSDEYSNYNAQSLGITLTMNNRKIFVAGDLVTKTELKILDDFEECDALIIGHHGYANSNCPEMLNIINAKHYFVPTYGTSGDDHAVINERIALYSTNYFSTHNNGDRITMYFDDKGFFHDAINKVNGTVVGDTDIVEDSVIRSVYTKVHPKQVCFYVSDTDKNGTSVQEVQFVDTNALTMADNMFKGCSALIRLSCSNWKMSKVISAKNMFDCCNKLSLIDVTNWDVSNIADMSAMFYYCTSLRTLNLSGWNTNKCTNMQWMFCRAWFMDEIIGIKELDVSNVTNMNSMFFYVGAYNLDLSGWNTGKVTDMRWMFADAWRLQTLNVTGWDTSKVTDMYTMFGRYEYGSPQLTTVTGMNTWDVSKVTNMYQLFWECYKLTNLDLSGWKLTSCTNMSWAFCDCEALNNLKLDGWNIPSTCNISAMFNKYNRTGCPALSNVSMKNSNSTSINKVIDVLPTRTSSAKGSLTITGVSDSTKVSTSSATSKYWTVTN
jgi:surface protein